ncbi:hypothetical protein EVAR_44505_1 [Eumeta japonica]|uniref:Uncharacterized protein n=1 Tax=Eumeta variegata TaxID=151549 RepID=A0A4C1WMJ7_EUMVA|nr:hypothetical protein EVAR_44505_1 [Eumeta japonica]
MGLIKYYVKSRHFRVAYIHAYIPATLDNSLRGAAGRRVHSPQRVLTTPVKKTLRKQPKEQSKRKQWSAAGAARDTCQSRGSPQQQRGPSFSPETVPIAAVTLVGAGRQVVPVKPFRRRRLLRVRFLPSLHTPPRSQTVSLTDCGVSSDRISRKVRRHANLRSVLRGGAGRRPTRAAAPGALRRRPARAQTDCNIEGYTIRKASFGMKDRLLLAIGRMFSTPVSCSTHTC